MKLRACGLALLVGLSLTPTARQGRAAEPLATVQVQPIGKTLGDIRAIAEKFGGKAALAKFNEKIEDSLGAKGLSGLDLDRPIVGYLNATAEVEDLGGVLVLPITDAKAFLDLLKRAGIDAEEIKDSKGLYALEMPDDANLGDKPVRLRVQGGNAYVGINVDNAELAVAKLIAPEKLTLPGEPAVLLLRQYLQRVPKELAERSKGQSKQVLDMLQGLPLPEEAKDALAGVMKLTARFNEAQTKEGDLYDLRIDLDTKTYELSFDTALTARPGTALAKEIAARKPTTNRFAGLVTKDTVVGFTTRLPLFAPEIREAIVKLAKFGMSTGEDKIPDPAKPIAQEAFKGLLRTIESGNFDIAAAVVGPAKNDAYGINFALSFDDPSAVEKEFRKLLKDAPEGVVKLDVAKVGGVSIHQASVGGFLPPEAKKTLGDKVDVCLAFAPKGVYVTVGADALAQIKAGLAAGPAPSPVLDIRTNGKKLKAFVEATGAPLPEQAARMFDKEDKLTSGFSLGIEGGEALRFRFRLRLTPFLQGLAEPD